MNSCYLFLVLAVAAVNSQVLDINWLVDLGCLSSNEFSRQHRFTATILPEGSLGPKVSYSESLLTGFDSAKRTDNCTLKVTGKDASIDLHYGLGLFQQTFNLLKINGNAMSGSYRIRDNSFHIAYTVHNTTRCYVTLDDLSLERLGKVELYSSRPEFDGIDVEDFFEEVRTNFNKNVNKAEIEKYLQGICKQNPKSVAEHMPLVHLAVVKQAKGLNMLSNLL